MLKTTCWCSLLLSVQQRWPQCRISPHSGHWLPRIYRAVSTVQVHVCARGTKTLLSTRINKEESCCQQRKWKPTSGQTSGRTQRSWGLNLLSDTPCINATPLRPSDLMTLLSKVSDLMSLFLTVEPHHYQHDKSFRQALWRAHGEDAP